ncbi:MAG: hypothetical protein NC342_01710 [Pseudoflavonifractor sp.]|nr:hypothetical protein [Alloprevotella sp.]MCM1116239.1 hypothetical protein [Pseudoflavonifractor sp.]
MKRLLPALILIALLVSCSSPSGERRRVEIARLDHAIMADSIAPDMEAAADAWLFVTRGLNPPLSEPLRDSLLRVEAASRAWQVFGPDTERLLPPLDEATAPLGLIDSLPGRVYGVISPYSQSVAIVDTIIFVALNHYLGPDYEGYGSMPIHIRRNKTLSHLPLDVAEAWTASIHPFPDTIAAPTLLSRMAYEGALIAKASDMLGIGDGAAIMGWTEREWDEAVAHEDEAWHRLLASDLLFSDSPGTITRMMAPGPSTPDISPDSPGRMGRFIGLRMIRAAGMKPDSILRSGAYLSPSILSNYARLHP